MKELRYLKVNGVLLPDNRLILRSSYLTDEQHFSVDVKASPLQIEFYKKDRLLFRWGVQLESVTIQGSEVLHFQGLRRQIAALPSNVLTSQIHRFHTAVPFPQNTDRIIFRCKDIAVHELTKSAKPPVFVKDVIIEKKKDSYYIDWRAEHPEKLPLHYIVRSSADSGKSWTRLTTSLNSTGIRVPNDSLIGGKDCMVEVVASDGLNTVTSRARVPDALLPRLEVLIIAPKDIKKPLIPPIELQAAAAVRGKPSLYGRKINFVWKANGKTIAKGPRAVWYNAKPGKYDLTVHANWQDMTDSTSLPVTIQQKQTDVSDALAKPVIQVSSGRNGDTKKILNTLVSENVLTKDSEGNYKLSEATELILKILTKAGGKGVTLLKIESQLELSKDAVSALVKKLLEYKVLKGDKKRLLLAPTNSLKTKFSLKTR